MARLNGDDRRSATAWDIQRALDTALDRAGQKLFPNPWVQSLDAPQRALLTALADGERPDIDSAAFRNLRDLHHLIARDGPDGSEPAFAFPLFDRWIRDHAPRGSGETPR